RNRLWFHGQDPDGLVRNQIFPFPPGHYYDGEKFVTYRDPAMVTRMHTPSFAEATTGIRDYLVKGVEKRLHADAPVGYLFVRGAGFPRLLNSI
ncbi:hypothetical protein ACW184_04450, partial [Limosilactobacillus fermentum]